MFAMMNSAEFGLAVLIPATIFYLLLLFLVVWASRAFERLLIVSGLLTAVYAMWCNLAVAAGDNVQIRAGQVGVALGIDAAGVLGRIAVLLVLSGLAVIAMNSGNGSASPSSREEGIHVRQD